MGWAKDAADQLAETGRAVVRPLGGSMRGRIESGQQVTLEPVTIEELSVGDAVFLKWKSGYLLHLVKKVDGKRNPADLGTKNLTEEEFVFQCNLNKIFFSS